MQPRGAGHLVHCAQADLARHDWCSSHLQGDAHEMRTPGL